MIKRCRVLYAGLSVAVALATAVPGVVSAAEGEEPEYHTDTHGAAGVAWGFLELSDVAPEYSKYWQGALDWIVSVSKTDEPNQLICPLVPLAPPDSKFSKPSGTYMCHTVSMFFRAYEKHGDRKYRDAGLAGARGVAAIMQKRDTREGRVDKLLDVGEQFWRHQRSIRPPGAHPLVPGVVGKNLVMDAVHHPDPFVRAAQHRVLVVTTPGRYTS